ncbi:MAG: hypothetical protein M3Y85_01150, partial [Bacteroidota bacterium]|nr:hypothetical protein [Bacteroidota bacterium]
MKNVINCFANKKIAVICAAILLCITACHRNPDVIAPPPPSPHPKPTSAYSSTVATKWLDVQTRILQLPAGPNIFGLNPTRYFAYCGVALYEAVVPGMPGNRSLVGQLTDMPEMPATVAGADYHWAACANAALAAMNRQLFPNTSEANKISIDSLENALNTVYKSEVPNDEAFQRSAAFGKEVAKRIYNWSLTDGSLTIYPT